MAQFEGPESNRSRSSARESSRRGVDLELLRDPNYVADGTVLEDADALRRGFSATSRVRHRSWIRNSGSSWRSRGRSWKNSGYDPSGTGRDRRLCRSARNTYALHNLATIRAHRPEGSFQTMTFNDKDYVSTRVSYKLT